MHNLLLLCYTKGGSQFKITLNDTITVNKLPVKVGSRIKLEKVGSCIVCGKFSTFVKTKTFPDYFSFLIISCQVLLVGGENFTIAGRPLVE